MQFLKNHKNIAFIILSYIFFIITGYILMFTPLGTISAAGDSINVMDGLYHYDYLYVNQTLTLLGETGRAQYTVVHIIDYFFLASYCLVMMSLTKLVVPAKVKWLWIALPLLPAMSDVIENTLIEIASAKFPVINESLNKTIAVFTTVKWTLGYVWFAVFIVLLIIYIINIIKKKRQAV